MLPSAVKRIRCRLSQLATQHHRAKLSSVHITEHVLRHGGLGASRLVSCPWLLLKVYHTQLLDHTYKHTHKSVSMYAHTSLHQTCRWAMASVALKYWISQPAIITLPGGEARSSVVALSWVSAAPHALDHVDRRSTQQPPPPARPHPLQHKHSHPVLQHPV